MSWLFQSIALPTEFSEFQRDVATGWEAYGPGASVCPPRSPVLSLHSEVMYPPYEFPGDAIQAGEHVWKVYTWVRVYVVELVHFYMWCSWTASLGR